MKKTITLSKAVELKRALETLRTEIYGKIKSIAEINITDKKITEYEELRDEMVSLISYLNEVIQETNLKKGKGESKSNNYHIKILSELKIFRKVISELEVDKKFQNDLIIKVKNIDKSINNLQDKLSKFNIEKKIKVEISDTILDLLTINLD